MSLNFGCVICSDPETESNPIFKCEDCTTSVHILCYGIKAPVNKSIEPWWCSPCAANVFRPACELCLRKGGALKKTTCEKWVHVICALFTEGVHFSNTIRMEPIDILGIPHKKHEKKCSFCSDGFGRCNCFHPNCENYFHVTCAQKNNCLKENTNRKNNKIVFEAYCHQHRPVSCRRISSVFVVEKSMEKFQHNESTQSEEQNATNTSNEDNGAAFFNRSSNDSSKSIRSEIDSSDAENIDDLVDRIDGKSSYSEEKGTNDRHNERYAGIIVDTAKNKFKE